MDAFTHCADLVRSEDRDRFLADLFAPEAARRGLFALHAFNVEVSRVSEVVREALPGEIRLQWWRDAIAGTDSAGDALANPVAAALIETIRTAKLPVAAFDRLIEARVFDLYHDPMPSLNDLEGYAGDTSSALIQLGAMILSDGADPGTAEAAGHAGVAYAITGLLRAFPYHARRQQLYLPADMMAEYGVRTDDVFSGRVTPELLRLLGALRTVARSHLGKIPKVAPAVAPAFLPVALAPAFLDRMDRPDYDPFHTAVDIPQWRRQWTLWRAARQAR